MTVSTESFAARLDFEWEIVFKAIEFGESIGLRATGNGPSVIRYIDVIWEAA